MKILTKAFPLLLAAAACGADKPPATPLQPVTVVAAAPVPAARPIIAKHRPAPVASVTASPPPAPPTTAPISADNTGTNVRDRASGAVTPMDQGNDDADLKTTQRIRQAVMRDSSLSFTAKNVKIITQGGKVTLRGPVNSAKERATVDAAAKSVAGDSQVDDQLEIEK
jgi:hyperosmotically inducible periplasmic protein